MKTQAPQKNESSSIQSSSPFFQKNESGNFFEKNPHSKDSFFSKPIIQRKFLGTDGGKVKVKNKSNQLEITSKNASADLKELVRLANASQSLTAIKQILKTSRNNSEITVKIEPKIIKNSLWGLHQAHDAKGNALKWDDTKKDFEGTPEYVKGQRGVYKAATITIFKGNIEASLKSMKDKGTPYEFSADQVMARVFSHETGHNTDKEFIKDLRSRREGKKYKGVGDHKNIDPLDDQVNQEMRDASKTTEEDLPAD